MSARIVPINTAEEEEEEVFAEHHDEATPGQRSEQQVDAEELEGPLLGDLSIVGTSLSPTRAAAETAAVEDLFPTQNQMEAHEARAMVLSCMDFRLLDDIVHFMNDQGYHNNYDQFILAGASLGYNQETYPHWGALWMEHLGLALKLHNVKEIICIDHDRCGAYKLFHPEMTPTQEHDYHVKNLTCFKCSMQEKYPDLKVSSYFMRLDGSCETV